VKFKIYYKNKDYMEDIIIINFNDITIKDKEIFDKYLKFSTTSVSEMTFTNFFMWRKVYGYRYAIIENLLIVVAFPEKGDCYSFFPIGDQSSVNMYSIKKIVDDLKEYFNKNMQKLSFKKITSDQANILNQIDKWDVRIDRDNWDYVYNSEDLIYLSGKRYDGKRNHINNFKKRYQFQYVKITDKNIDECCRITDEWCKYMDCKHKYDLLNEKNANYELLNNFYKLDLKGGLIEVNGKCEAYSIGEMLNKNMTVIHIEKANIGIRGIYQIINQQFCKNEWSNVQYINREQDLGIEGIRKAKESYYPIFYIEKYHLKIL
jgi:hypothetical protein